LVALRARFELENKELKQAQTKKSMEDSRALHQDKGIKTKAERVRRIKELNEKNVKVVAAYNCGIANSIIDFVSFQVIRGRTEEASHPVYYFTFHLLITTQKPIFHFQKPTARGAAEQTAQRAVGGVGQRVGQGESGGAAGIAALHKTITFCRTWNSRRMATASVCWPRSPNALFKEVHRKKAKKFHQEFNGKTPLPLPALPPPPSHCPFRIIPNPTPPPHLLPFSLLARKGAIHPPALPFQHTKTSRYQF
jgi:hypothetical protein